MKKSQLGLNEPTTAVGPLRTAVEEVDAIITDLDHRRAALEYEETATIEALKKSEEEMGQRYLDGDMSAMREVVELRAKTEAITLALAALKKRREALVKDRRIAEARDARVVIAEKQVELERIKARVAPLLAQLSEIEGVEFTAAILCSQRSGSWTVSRTIGSPTDFHSPADCCPEPVGANAGGYFSPRSRELAREIARLEMVVAVIEMETNPPANVRRAFREPEAERTAVKTQPEVDKPATAPHRRRPSTPEERDEQSRRDGWVPFQ